MTEFDSACDWLAADCYGLGNPKQAPSMRFATSQPIESLLRYPRLRELLEEAGCIRGSEIHRGTADPFDTETWYEFVERDPQ